MLLQVVLPVETRLKRGKWACFGCSPFTGDKAAAQFPPFLPAGFVLQYPQVTKLPKYNSKEERFLKQNTTMDLVANREVCDR